MSVSGCSLARSRALPRAGVLAGVMALACRPVPPSPPASPVIVEAAAPPSVSLDEEGTPEAERDADLLRAFPPEPEGALWVDFDALRRSPFQPALAPLSATWFGAQPPEIATACPGNPVDGLRELVIGDAPGGKGIFLVRLDRPAVEWEPCLRKLATTGLDSARELRTFGDVMILTETAELADEALERLRAAGPLSPTLASLQEHARRALLAFGASEFNVALRLGSSDIDLLGLFRASSPESAQRMLDESRREFAEVIHEKKAGDVALTDALCQFLSHHLSLSLEGDTVRAAIRGPFSPQLAGDVVETIHRAIRDYLAFQRILEARNELYVIAERLASTLNGRQPRPFLFPASTPLTPSRLPGAAGHLVTGADFAHPTWQVIDYSKTGLMHYAYEIRTSRDRKRAVVRARGDLDEDGVESRFELTVSVDVTSGSPLARVEYPMQETNPGE